MKKTILVALLAIFTIGFTACKKDKNAADSIANTTWVWNSGNETEVLSFTDGSNVTITDSTDGQLIMSMETTYSYDAPDVTINMLGQSINGTVDGNTMTMSDGNDSKSYNKK